MNAGIFWAVFGAGILITCQLLIHSPRVKLDSYFTYMLFSWIGLFMLAIGAALL